MCERCEILEEENRQLRDQLGLQSKEAAREALRRAFELTANEAHICALLYQRFPASVRLDALTKTQPVIRHEDNDPRTATVLVCRIRKKIGRDTIKNDWGHGYCLTEQGRKRLHEAFGA